MSMAEKATLARMQGAGKTPTAVAKFLGRDLSVINRHFIRNKAMKAVKPVGRPAALTEEQKSRCVRTKMFKHRKGEQGASSACCFLII